MGKIILAKKLHMSQIFNQDGRAIPVTILEAGPIIVTQVKTERQDGYEAVQVGYGARKKTPKPIAGKLAGTPFEKSGARWLREFRGSFSKRRGDIIDVGVFAEGDKVTISGTTKGKGFQGVVKRHGFHGAPKTHGTKHAHRQPGSIGSTGPQRVFKGQKMAGRMGGERCSLHNVEVVKVDKERNQLYLKGAIPGFRGGLVEIKRT